MSEDLPEGWARALLPELFELNPPKPPSNALSPEATVTFVPMPAVDAVAGAITAAQERPFAEVRKGYTAFADGDVILAKITPCFENGKAAVARGLSNGLGFGSSEFHVLRPKGAVIPEYLFHFLRQDRFRDEAAANMTGTAGQARVPAHYLKEVSLSFPPLAEQRRIVKKVEALLARVNAAREHLGKVPAILKRFRRSVLACACSGRLTEDWRDLHPDVAPMDRELRTRRAAVRTAAGQPRRDPHDAPEASTLPPIPETWGWARLPELGELNRGKSKHRPRNDPRLFGGAFPFIQTGDVARSGGTITEHSQTYNEVGLAQSRLWPARTVCITIAANIAESGLLAYPACFPDSVVGLIADPSICIPEYVEFFIRTARDDLAQYAPATAQKNINLEILRADVSVPLPPLGEQEEIVKRMEALFSLTGTIERRAGPVTSCAANLSESVLAKAFNGELVPTEAELAQQAGLGYEPASALLERIRREPAGEEEGSTAGRTRRGRRGGRMAPSSSRRS